MTKKKDNPGIQGRPTVMTESNLGKLEQAYKIGCTNYEASAYADISEATLYAYFKEHPDFLEKTRKWKENPILLARTTVVKGLVGDKELAFKYLTKRRPEEFTDKVTIDAKLKYDPADFKDMTDSEVAATLNTFLTE